MWIDPHETGTFVGQCAQYCGTQHAKMLLRVVVESSDDFEKWAGNEKNPAAQVAAAANGRKIFESNGMCELPYDRGHQCSRKVRA